MITFVYGGSSSGKSSFAETLLSQNDKATKYYLATMDAYDAESIKRIERHRKLRSGKGFKTIERPRDIYKAAESITDRGDSAVLLECMSNLVANEMFATEEMLSPSECTTKVMADIKQLIKATTDLIIVSNNIFEDGITYDDGTKAYLEALGTINQQLACISDQVYEVVVGIPIRIK